MLACWVCESKRTTAYKSRTLTRPLEPGDLQISDANYGATLSLRRCEDCGFIFAEGEELPELFHLYEALEDQGYEESQDSRALQMEWLLDQASAARPGMRSMLDVGAATGLLVELGTRRGFQATGVEPSRSLVEVARASHGVELLKGTIPHPSLEGRTFDVVFLVDVIEHVSEPVTLLRDAARYLAPGGILMVVTPDVASVARKLLRERWWHFRLAHVGYFDDRSFGVACERAGLTVSRRLRAKWFFRVSYLLERVARYLPFTRGLRLSRGFLAERIVPLNLFDSWVFVCRNAQ
jgi:SAM-dependent methyltransferase